MFQFNQEKVAQHLNQAKEITFKTAKYGAVFTSGVLLGTICGFVLFFYVQND